MDIIKAFDICLNYWRRTNKIWFQQYFNINRDRGREIASEGSETREREIDREREIYKYIYIYINRERERERERERVTAKREKN